MNVETLLRQYALGDRTTAYPENRHFSNVELNQINLIGAMLSGAFLALANFKQTDLSGANLSQANLSRKTNLAATGISHFW